MFVALAVSALATAALWLQVECAVHLRGESNRKVSIGSRDQLQIAISEIFDLSDAFAPRVYTNSTYLGVSGTFTRAKDRKLDLSFVRNVTTFFKAGASIAAYIYDETKIAYFDTNATAPLIKDFVRNEQFSEGGACFDAYFNPVSSKVIVLCEDRPTPPILAAAPSKRIFLYVLDFKTGELLQSKMVYLPNGMEIPIGLRVRVIRTPAADGLPANSFMIIYSQGNSFRHRDLNLDMVICQHMDDPDAINFDCTTVLNLKENKIGIVALHDFYVFGQDILITGEHESGKVMITKCAFNFTKPGILCSGGTKLMPFSHGYVAPLSMNRFVQLDFENETATVCPTIKKWDAVCPLPVDFNIGKNNWVRDAELNRGLLFLSLHSRANDDYAGYAMLEVAAGKMINMLYDSSALIYDRNLMYRASYPRDVVSTSYVEEDYILVDPANFSMPFLNNKFVKVTAMDNESRAEVVLELDWVTQYIGNPSFASNTVIPDLELLDGSFFEWPISHEHIFGNGLNFTLEFLGEVKPLIQSEVIHTGLLDVQLKVPSAKDHRRQNFTDFYFGEGYLIGLDVDNMVDFYACIDPNYKLLACDFRKAAKTILQAPAKIIEAGKFAEDYYFAVLQSGEEVEVFVFDGLAITSQEIHAKVLAAEGFLAFNGLQEDSSYVGTVALSVEVAGKQFVNFIQHLPDKQRISPVFADITAANTESGFFCPRLLTATSEGMLYITSTCPEDNRIYVFAMPNTDAPLLDIPISSSLEVSSACFYEEHVLIAGRHKADRAPTLYLTGLYHNFQSREYFGLDSLGIPREFSVECVSGAELFAVHYTKEGNSSTAVFYAKSSARASKRLHSRLENKTSGMRAFSINGALLVAGLASPGELTAYSSLNRGPVLISEVGYGPVSGGLQAGAQEPKVYLGEGILTATDPNRRQAQARFYTRITTQNYSITAKKRENRTFEAGRFNLDSALVLEGPIRNAQVVGASAAKARIEPRVKQVGSHACQPLDHVHSYEFIDNFELKNFTVAARQTRGVFQKRLYVDVFNNELFQYQVAIPVTSRVQTLTSVFDRSGNPVVLFVETSFFSMARHELKAALIRNGSLKSVTSVDLISATNIQSHVDGENLFLFALDAAGVTVYKANLTSLASSRFREVFSIPGLRSFSVFRNASEFVVAGVQRGVYQLRFWSFDLRDASNTTRPAYGIALPKKYEMTSLLCSVYGGSEVVCLANTASAYVAEFSVYLASLEHSIFFHLKYTYYEVRHLEFAGDFIVAQATTSRPGLREFELHVWKLARSGGRGKLAYAVPLNGPRLGLQPLNFSVAVSARDQSVRGYDGHVAVSGAGPDSPLTFYKISDFQFEILQKDFDPNTMKIQFIGAAAANVAMVDLYTFESPKEDPAVKSKGLSWIVWTLIIIAGIAVVVLLAQGLKHFLQNRSAVYDKAEVNEPSYSKAGDSIAPQNFTRTIHDDTEVPA